MGQHRHHTTGETWKFPTRPPSHLPLPTGEIRDYNILSGMLVSFFHASIRAAGTESANRNVIP